MKIAVFGGGGFIGSAVVDRLLKEDHEIRIFERPRVVPYRSFTVDERVEWIAGDLMSTHDVSRALEGVDVVMHLVSTTLPGTSNDDPVYDVQTNVVSTIQILQAMVAKKVGKIVFISSGGTIYGKPNCLPITEEHPTNPLVSYGITKLAIEKFILMYQYLHCIKACILRVSNPYGERQRVNTGQGVVTAFVDKALRGEPIEVWGDGSVIRDYLYIDDLAEAFASAVDYDGDRSVFNIGHGVGTEINALLGEIEGVLAQPVARRYRPARIFDVPANVLDISLAAKELGWKPNLSLREGIELMVQRWSKHENKETN